jgi:hypothetical protein
MGVDAVGEAQPPASQGWVVHCKDWEGA